MSDFKLQAEDGNGPRVGDRYVLRNMICEVVEVSPDRIAVEVSRAKETFRETHSREVFKELEQRTLARGAVFKPSEVPHE